MSVMNVEMLNKEYLIGELKKMGKYAYQFINMVDFVLSGNFDEYFVELHEKFQKNDGRPAFPRQILLLVVLCAYCEGVHSCREMEKLCEFDNRYLIISYGLKPSFKTFERFLKEMDLKGVESLFIGTLDIANNYGVLNFDTLNLDGSIALNSGSKYNKIYPDQLKILIKANDLNLLLNYHRTKKECKKELKGKMRKYQI